MSLSDLLPNIAILRQPWNWFVVAFSLVVLALILHFAVCNKNSEN